MADTKKPDTFMSLCMHHQVKEKGTEQQQAIAICMQLQKKWGEDAGGWKTYQASKKSEEIAEKVGDALKGAIEGL